MKIHLLSLLVMKIHLLSLLVVVKIHLLSLNIHLLSLLVVKIHLLSLTFTSYCEDSSLLVAKNSLLLSFLVVN